MKSLMAILILALPLISAQGVDPGGDGPALEVASLSGRLQLDLPSTLSVELRNNASALPEAIEFDAQKRDAMGITAELLSDDERIKVISARQTAGKLGPGENRTIEFMVLASDSEAGIYPLQLRLGHFRLSGVTTSGDQRIPDVLFAYENITQEIPLQARVVLGPKIQAEQPRGDAYPGKESELQLVFANRGDEPAVDLWIEAYSQPPFRVTDGAGESLGLEPGSSTIEKLKVFTDNATTPGYYALPYRIYYQDGNLRSRESAALVYVQRDSFVGWIEPLIGILLLAGAIFGAREYLKGKRRKKMKRWLRG